MGGGEFPEWDSVAVDIATMPLINKQLEKAVAALSGGFSLIMGQLIGWEDLKGIHGLGTGLSKFPGLGLNGRFFRLLEFQAGRQRYFILGKIIIAL